MRWSGRGRHGHRVAGDHRGERQREDVDQPQELHEADRADDDPVRVDREGRAEDRRPVRGVQQPEEEEGLEGEVQAGDEQGPGDPTATVHGVDPAVGHPVGALGGVGLADRPGELGELLDASADDEFGLVDLIRGSLGKKGHRPFRLDSRDTEWSVVTSLPSSSRPLTGPRGAVAADVRSSRRSSPRRNRRGQRSGKTVRPSPTVLTQGDVLRPVRAPAPRNIAQRWPVRGRPQPSSLATTPIRGR